MSVAETAAKQTLTGENREENQINRRLWKT